jgi:outer membrane protein TolC
LFSALNLNDCYSLALANSEKVNIAELKALMEEDRTREVLGLALPQLSAKADFITKGEAKNVRHHDRTKNARVSLTFPLFNFGGFRNAIYAQEKREESFQIDTERTKQDVLYLTNQIYFSLLEALKFEQILKDSIQILEGQLKITQDFKEQGLVHENELLLVEVELSLTEQDLIQAQNFVALIRARLNRLIGYEMNYLTEIDDVSEKKEPFNFSEVLFYAKNNHPLLLSLAKQVEAAEFLHKAEKGRLYPVIYGYTNYSTTDDYALPYKHGVDAGIGITLSLYDGGITYAKLRRLKKEILEAEQRYQLEERNLELNLRSAFLTLNNAEKKLQVASKGIDLAQRNLKATQDHYLEGLITNVDVINDEDRLLKAKSNHTQALYQYYRAIGDIEYAAGILIYEENCHEG